MFPTVVTPKGPSSTQQEEVPPDLRRQSLMGSSQMGGGHRKWNIASWVLKLQERVIFSYSPTEVLSQDAE